MRAAAAGHHGANPDAKAASLASGAALRDAQRQLVEQRIMREAGELVRREDMMALLNRVVGDLKGLILSLPDIIIIKCDLPLEMRAQLEAIVDEELANVSARGVADAQRRAAPRRRVEPFDRSANNRS